MLIIGISRRAFATCDPRDCLADARVAVGPPTWGNRANGPSGAGSWGRKTPGADRHPL